MRLRVLVAAISLAMSLAVVTPIAAPAQAAPPPCGPVHVSGCVLITTPGARGAISIIGDSVLLGSIQTAPTLPTMLAQQGWGPIRFQAGLGYRTGVLKPLGVDAYSYADWWINRWRQVGWDAPVVAFNLGANDFCTSPGLSGPPPSKACMKTSIEYLLNVVGPTKTVWWAGITMLYSPNWTTWNAALNEVAAARPNLIVWDWPAALAANPSIRMAGDNTHLYAGSDYVKRNTLMADSITTQMSAARFAGPRVAIPPAASAPLEYQPVDAFTTLDTSTTAPLGPSARVEIDLSVLDQTPDAAKAVVLTLRQSAAAGSGFLTAFPCDGVRPLASNLNYLAAGSRSAQAVSMMSADQKVCVFTSAATHLQVFIDGYFIVGEATRFSPQIPPARLLDTRQTGLAAISTLTMPAGAQAVAINITATGLSSGGTVSAYPCDAPSTRHPNVSFGASETIAASTYVPVSVDGTICVELQPSGSVLANVIVDLTGTFSDGGSLAFVAAATRRLLDTRSPAIGGWVGRHGVQQILDVVVAPAGALAVTGTLTMVRPVRNGHLVAFACDLATPATSAVNAPAGRIIANSVTVGVPADRRLCLLSVVSTNTIFDVAGWWVA